MDKIKHTAVVISLACIMASCASLHAYTIVLTTRYDGNAVIKNETNVVSFLEQVILNSEDYSLAAFDRTAISYRVRKTISTTHSFYVIRDVADTTYNTLSFSATGKGALSKGAWAINTFSDVSSYTDYLEGNNKWEVEEIITKNGINTPMTIQNILSKIQRNTRYFFRSKVNKKNRYDNCNTALLETLVENE